MNYPQTIPPEAGAPPPDDSEDNQLLPHLSALVKRCILLRYNRNITKLKSPKHVVQDLGGLLPGVERWVEVWRLGNLHQRPQRFLIFCSDDPRARSLCGSRKTIQRALLHAFGEARPRTSFQCKPPSENDKQWVAEKITSSDLPYVGADWVIERDFRGKSDGENEVKQTVSRPRRSSRRAGKHKAPGAGGNTKGSQLGAIPSSSGEAHSAQGASKVSKERVDTTDEEGIKAAVSEKSL